MISIWGESKGGVIVAEDFACQGIWMVGKYDIILCEALLNHRVGGNKEDPTAAEMEMDDGAIVFGQIL